MIFMSDVGKSTLQALSGHPPETLEAKVEDNLYLVVDLKEPEKKQTDRVGKGGT